MATGNWQLPSGDRVADTNANAGAWQVPVSHRVYEAAAGGGGDVTVTLTSQLITSSQGTETSAIGDPLGSQLITSSQGTAASAIGDPLGSQLITSSQGTTTSAIGDTLGTQLLLFSEGTITASGAADVTRTLTTQLMSSSQGPVTTTISGDVTLTLSGQTFNTLLGTVKQTGGTSPVTTTSAKLGPPPVRDAMDQGQIGLNLSWLSWFSQLYIWLTSGNIGVSIHNLLTGIQGGAPGDYQHLTTAQVAAIGTGTKGDTGQMGPMGFEGEEGPEGLMIPGNSGPQGQPGVTGTQGPTGPATFLEAEQGDEGAQGPQGLIGPQGTSIFLWNVPNTVPGPDGEPGDDGPIGPPGPAGTPATPGSAAFGEMVIDNNATGLVCTTQNVWYQVTSGWATGDLNGFTYSGGALTCKTAGSYLTTANASLNSTSSNQVYRVQIFINGAGIFGHDSELKLVNSTDVNSITVTGIKANVQIGDVLTLWVQNTTSNGQTLLISDANFAAVAVAGATGLTGATGATGLDGFDGEDGMSIMGPQGPQGSSIWLWNNPTAIHGMDGEDGMDPVAIPGATGPQGQPGIQGQVGPMAFDGDQGEEGQMGPQGAVGPVGQTGALGPAGLDGEEGPDSVVPGPQGLQGTSIFLWNANIAIQGLDGEEGPEGFAIPGPAGPAGASGAASNWPMVKNSALVSDTITIPVGFQLIVVRNFTNAGSIVNNGDFAIL